MAILVIATAGWIGPPRPDKPFAIPDRSREDARQVPAAIDNGAAAGLTYRHLSDAGFRDFCKAASVVRF